MITVYRLRDDNIESFIREHPTFSYLEKVAINERKELLWNRKTGELSEDVYYTTVILIGKTGYGKSTTLNKITRTNLFATNDNISCTKQLYCIEYKLSQKSNHYFSLGDLPGVGESIEEDRKYIEWYKEFIDKTHVVVYLFRADQRDFAWDEGIFKKLFDTPEKKNKLVYGINFIDKIEPINRNYPFSLSEKQKENVEKKVNDISKIFNIDKKDIVCFSSQEDYNLNLLMNKINQKLKSNLKNDILF